jgi:hypothetical protein
MYQFLDTVQYSVSNVAASWTALPASERATVGFVCGVFMVYLCIKDRDVEYTSIAMGLGALLMFAYSLAITIDFFH